MVEKAAFAIAPGGLEQNVFAGLDRLPHSLQFFGPIEEIGPCGHSPCSDAWENDAVPLDQPFQDRTRRSFVHLPGGQKELLGLKPQHPTLIDFGDSLVKLPDVSYGISLEYATVLQRFRYLPEPICNLENCFKLGKVLYHNENGEVLPMILWRDKHQEMTRS